MVGLNMVLTGNVRLHPDSFFFSQCIWLARWCLVVTGKHKKEFLAHVSMWPALEGTRDQLKLLRSSRPNWHLKLVSRFTIL